MPIRKCDQCGREYMARRKTSRFCSDKCRVNAARGKIPTDYQNADLPEITREGAKKITRRQIADSVVAIRGGAQTLNAGAEHAPEDLRELCRVLSVRVLNALDEVGL